ncbi:MAG: ABC transporter permease/M1 family aminopeptidase [Calditrichia bacterium]
MLKNIFNFEMKYWLRQPSVYMYVGFFLLLSLVTMWGVSTEAPKEIVSYSNAPLQLFKLADFYSILLLLLIPALVGMSVYRDYSSNTHTLLYSYPFKKNDYLLGKFLSSFLLVVIIASTIGIGAAIGTQLPGADPRILLPFDPVAYLQLFMVYIIPNCLLFSCVAFSVVALTRNIYAGFVAVVLLLLFRTFAGLVLGKSGSFTLVVLLDPLGKYAVEYYTRYWSSSELNSRLLPMEELFVFNRLIWLFVSAALFGWTYRTFAFSQQAVTSSFQRRQSDDKVERARLSEKLPVNYLFNLKAEIKAIFRLSWFEFRSMVSSWAFLSLLAGGFLVIITLLFIANPRWETTTYPVTWQMLELPALLFSGIVNFITFLYAGMLIQRAPMARMNQLVDVSPWPNRTMLFSKFLALIKTQVFMLAILMIGGILTQASKGYFNFEIPHYLFELFVLHLTHFIIYACLAFFIQTLSPNVYLGFFVLVFLPLGLGFIGENAPKMGLHFLEQAVFRFNQVPTDGVGSLAWSDMDGYGAKLSVYLIYKLYWLLAGGLLLIGTLLFWQRGMPVGIIERVKTAAHRFKGKTALAGLILMLLFLGMGYHIYAEANIVRSSLSKPQRRTSVLRAEKEIETYAHLVQPSIKAVDIELDIFPSKRNVVSKGSYSLLNENKFAVDTLLIFHFKAMNTSYRFTREHTLLKRDSVANIAYYDLVLLSDSLLPDSGMTMTFEMKTSPNTWLHSNTIVKGNGTFIKDDVFPRFGNWVPAVRNELSMPGRPDKALPSDSAALRRSFISFDSDWIDFNAVVSTSADQIAVAPGTLLQEWRENGRRYYHYRAKEPISHAFLFTSGRFSVLRDKWKDVDLEIYYHPDHAYNLERMMRGMKAGLDYCSENYSPYQFDELRLIEFSQTGRVTAHAYPGILPFGEGAGFIADVDDSESGGVDYPFSTAVHETAHQWWPYQLMPADVRGAKVLSESMAEFVDVQVTRKTHGEAKMRKYLSYSRDQYLKGRRNDRRDEAPLALTFPDQNYLNYPKGALVFRALGELLGESVFNAALQNLMENKSHAAPFSTTTDLIAALEQETPDSLKYAIDDMLKTITFYDNRMITASAARMEDGRYKLTIEFLIRKHRAEGGEEESNEERTLRYEHQEEVLKSLPLNDYIDIAAFGESNSDSKFAESALYLQKHRVQKIYNKLEIVVDEKPVEVVVDPWFVLLETDILNNRKEITMNSANNGG